MSDRKQQIATGFVAILLAPVFLVISVVMAAGGIWAHRIDSFHVEPLLAALHFVGSAFGFIGAFCFGCLSIGTFVIAGLQFGGID